MIRWLRNLVFWQRLLATHRWAWCPICDLWLGEADTGYVAVHAALREHYQTHHQEEL